MVTPDGPFIGIRIRPESSDRMGVHIYQTWADDLRPSVDYPGGFNARGLSPEDVNRVPFHSN